MRMSSGVRGNAAALLFGIACRTSTGQRAAIDQWKGKVLVVNFWATWCVALPRGDAGIRESAEGVGRRRAAIRRHRRRSTPTRSRQFAAELGLNYPALIGGYGAIELSKTLGNRVGALPYTVFVDRGGRISRAQLGPIKPAELHAIISQLL